MKAISVEKPIDKCGIGKTLSQGLIRLRKI
jgi:hypothetical protein